MKILNGMLEGIGRGLLSGLSNLPNILRGHNKILGYWIEHDKDGIPQITFVTKKENLPRWHKDHKGKK